jgi:nucleoside 2-deoxyribosyltransferase
MQCYFCNHPLHGLEDKYPESVTFYQCKVCGPVRLTEAAAEKIKNGDFSASQMLAVSIYNRNEFENRGRTEPPRAITTEDLTHVTEQYRSLDPLEKIDQVLFTLKKQTKHVGQWIQVDCEYDYTRYHCLNPGELRTILIFLVEMDLVKADQPNQPDLGLWISAQGYKRLRELETARTDLRQCFVAMWYNPEMIRVYKHAIQPAIEYLEAGASEPCFKAIRVDNVEHANDINDEIIAQIKRSRFMVCDLTGHRGGVYFEAGFAYGLGLPVIYTCRKDWAVTDDLWLKPNTAEDAVGRLYDSNGNAVDIQKEGIHFDLVHWNRIEWQENRLDDFRVALENRIKAVIV